MSAQYKLTLIIGLAGLYIAFRVFLFRLRWRRVRQVLDQPRPPEA